jgi:hypothetical protein
MNEDTKMFLIFIVLYFYGIMCGLAIYKINQNYDTKRKS